MESFKFENLDIWKLACQYADKIHNLTKNFPRDELFGLVNQLRRAAVSITSNIAEGFSRNSFKEKLQFYSMALGSLTELQNQLLIARDIGYLIQEDFKRIADQTVTVSKITNGLIKKSKTIIHNS